MDFFEVKRASFESIARRFGLFSTTDEECARFKAGRDRGSVGPRDGRICFVKDDGFFDEVLSERFLRGTAPGLFVRGRLVVISEKEEKEISLLFLR